MTCKSLIILEQIIIEILILIKKIYDNNNHNVLYIKLFSAFTISISGEIIITSFHTGTFLHQMNTDAKRAHTCKEQGLLFKQIFLTEILSSEHKWASIPVFFFQ